MCVSLELEKLGSWQLLVIGTNAEWRSLFFQTVSRERKTLYILIKNRRLNKSILARPYICRFSIFNRLICPSTGPLLTDKVTPALTES